MRVRINKRFLKDLSKIPAADRKRIENFVFEESESIQSIESSGMFEKLKGYQSFYRIRFGDYRVGVSFHQGELTFERVLHRKDIYRFFP